MDILSYILSKKNSGSNPGGSGGSSSGSSASVEVAGGGTLVDPTKTYSRLYFNTSLSNEEVMALMDDLELTYEGMGNILYITIYSSGEMDGILAAVIADTGTYALMRMSTSEILFAINGNVVDESITFTGWNPNIDLSNGIEISGETFGTELPMDGGPIPIGADNNKIVNLFSSEPIKESINKGLSGIYDGNDLEVRSTHIDVSSLLAENKLPLNIDVVDDSLIPSNIVYGVNILGVEGSYTGIIPSGEIKITSTDLIDVTNYAHARVVDKNLVAANIARNKTILGVTGTYAGDPSLEDRLITRTVTSYSNDRVTSIGNGAFSHWSNLTNVNFPLVTKIGNYAFSNCTSLTDINIPQLTNVGVYAFADCSKLTSVNLPKTTYIANYTFSNCANLTSIDFPLATGVGDYAFSECKKLTDINIPRATNIESCAFYDCTNLTSVDFPLVTFIRNYVFWHCTSLTDIKIPQLTYVGAYAFKQCEELTSVDFPLVSHIDTEGFSSCSKLTSINFPNVKTVLEGAFMFCPNLISVDLPVASLKWNVFSTCVHLISVNIPNATSIENHAFSSCYSLVKLFISQTDQVCTLDNTDAFSQCWHIRGFKDERWNPEGLKDGYIYVPASLLSQYKVATNWSFYASQIIGHEDLEVGATLPNYTTDSFTTQTWYSDEKLTTIVTEVATSGKYYCRLEA